MIFKVFITPTALKMLTEIPDARVREKIRHTIDRLQREPEKQGTPLLGELAGYYSIRGVGHRYRISYRVEKERVVVLVVAVGLRREGSKKDIYTLAKKLLRLKLVK